MRGRCTEQFLADSLRATAKFLKSEGRPTAALRCKQSADRLELLECQLRNADARARFIEECLKEKGTETEKLLQKVWDHMRGYNLDGSWRGSCSVFVKQQSDCLRNWNELHKLIADHFENRKP